MTAKVVASFALILLAGCATPRASRPLLAPDVQEAVLREISSFTLSGRTAVTAGDENVTAALGWKQRGDEAEFKLTGPLGAGSITVSWSPTHLRLSNGKGEVYENGEAELVLTQQLGFVPPFNALRYWVLGMAAPGEPPTERSVEENGRIGALTQQQWQIRYRDWMTASTGSGGVAVPRRLVVSRDEVRLQVVVRKWQL